MLDSHKVSKQKSSEGLTMYVKWRKSNRHLLVTIAQNMWVRTLCFYQAFLEGISGSQRKRPKCSLKLRMSPLQYLGRTAMTGFAASRVLKALLVVVISYEVYIKFIIEINTEITIRRKIIITFLLFSQTSWSTKQRGNRPKHLKRSGFVYTSCVSF